MYCGNNANHSDLLNGKKTLGTRYSCLLKGKSFGFESEPDKNFLKPYNPIDKTKKYCGNSDVLPDGYDRFGGLYECYLKGIGVGKKLKAETYYKKSKRKSRNKKNRKSIRKSRNKKNRKSIRKSRNKKNRKSKK
jgi:hypothetical protein